jgi:hypothetical protein
MPALSSSLLRRPSPGLAETTNNLKCQNSLNCLPNFNLGPREVQRLETPMGQYWPSNTTLYIEMQYWSHKS